jgi:hypothetical protein
LIADRDGVGGGGEVVAVLAVRGDPPVSDDGVGSVLVLQATPMARRIQAMRGVFSFRLEISTLDFVSLIYVQSGH